MGVERRAGEESEGAQRSAGALAGPHDPTARVALEVYAQRCGEAGLKRDIDLWLSATREQSVPIEDLSGLYEGVVTMDEFLASRGRSHAERYEL